MAFKLLLVGGWKHGSSLYQSSATKDISSDIRRMSSYVSCFFSPELQELIKMRFIVALSTRAFGVISIQIKRGFCS